MYEVLTQRVLQPAGAIRQPHRFQQSQSVRHRTFSHHNSLSVIGLRFWFCRTCLADCTPVQHEILPPCMMQALVPGLSACASAWCRYLEDELAVRYRDAAPGTLALLQVREIIFPYVVSKQTNTVLCRMAAVDNVHRSRRAEGQQPPSDTALLSRIYWGESAMGVLGAAMALHNHGGSRAHTSHAAHLAALQCTRLLLVA